MCGSFETSERPAIVDGRAVWVLTEPSRGQREGFASGLRGGMARALTALGLVPLASAVGCEPGNGAPAGPPTPQEIEHVAAG